MAERNWGLITTGATFEALATTLVFFEDAKAALFGRRGKDGGQDARSGDGLRVFQAKHHEDGSAAKAIADAKKEAAKIAEYRKPGNARFEQWRNVTHWRLVTNATFNPTDHQSWIDDVVPLFKAIGLEIDYWERAHLNALLDKWHEVDRSYFGNEPRAFLTLPETRQQLAQEEPFLQRSAPSCVGRDKELASVAAFIKSAQVFLVVTGSGGIGKTRLLLEAGDAAVKEGWQVLWANVATISAGANWFDGIVPERRTVLVVDEPDDEEVLRLISEQLGGRVGRGAQWKVLIAVRSPKDPVLKFLSSPKLTTRVQWLSVDQLSREAAQAMCRELIDTGPLAASPAEWREDVAGKLADRFSRQPIWLTLAVHLLETHKDINQIPDSAVALADLYLNEVIRYQTNEEPERVRQLLRWVALVGTVNRENDGAIRLIGEGISDGANTTATLGSLARLVERRALRQRGANGRLVELKPDVLRDHVLREWLVVDVGFGEERFRPSEAAKALIANCNDAIEKGGLSAVGLAILKSIGRTELLFRLDEKPVLMLDGFFKKVLRNAASLSASKRLALCETLAEIAWLRPSDVTATSRALRGSPVDTESVKSIFGSRDVNNDQVVLELAWPVFHAAMGARDAQMRLEVLEELYELAQAEADINARLGRLPNDGRRAGQLLGRTLQGGPHFWSDFDDAVCSLALRTLEQLRASSPTKVQEEAIRALVVPAVGVEREQTSWDDNTFTIRRFVILPGHPGWKTRALIIEKVKALLGDDTVPTGTHVLLWRLIAAGNRRVNYSVFDGPPEFQKLMHAEFLAELEWTQATLKQRGRRLDEMKAARELWDWHAKYEKDPEVKQAAQALEELYNEDALAAEFEPLLHFDTLEQFDQRAQEKAAQLSAAGADEISAFLERGGRYIGDERSQFALNAVAVALGARADTEPTPRAFALKTLSNPQNEQKLAFVLALVSRWIFDKRKERGAAEAFAVLRELLDHCADEPTTVRALVEVYGFNPPKLKSQELAEAEQAFLRGQSSLFKRQAKSAWFVGIVSWTLLHEWVAYKALIENELSVLTEPTLTQAVANLVQGVFWATYKSEDEFPFDLGRWLLDQVIRVADFDKLSSNTEYRIDEVLKVLGPIPLEWLPRALKVRAALEAQSGYSKSKALSHDIVLGDYVKAIDETQKDDPEVARLVSELLDLLDDQGTVGYRLPDILHQLDPDGFVLAPQLAERIRRSDPSDVKRLARLARAYVINTPAWRTVAEPAMVLALKLEAKERLGLFNALVEAGVRQWSGNPGEVSVVFVHAVEAARGYRDRETDAQFRPFWDWYVSVAEAELKRQEEDAKEERGE